MATEEDLKKAEHDDDAAAERELDEGEAETALRRSEAPAPEVDGSTEDEADESSAPIQLGYQRYVYAAYMAGAMLVAFLAAKIGHASWYRLGQWKPELGEPKDELVYPVAGVVGVLVAIYYWRKADARQYADEVAEELSKVTWPSRKEVTNSTTVVVFTTLFATVFFALMDRFWGFVTDKIYTF